MTREPPKRGAAPAPVVVARRFDAPRARVFAVWTQPEHMKRWLHPGPEWSTPVVEVDLRVGGRYRLGFLGPGEAALRFVVGRFLELQRDERLVYTWTWEPPDPHAGVETLVTVSFADAGSGTRVVVTHERFPDDEVRARHATGWEATLLCLDETLETDA